MHEDETIFPVIELDWTLLGKVLTEYGHLIGHIEFTTNISVTDVKYDEKSKILTTFINLEEQTLH